MCRISILKIKVMMNGMIYNQNWNKMLKFIKLMVGKIFFKMKLMLKLIIHIKIH
jgi:hypothetical protein